MLIGILDEYKKNILKKYYIFLKLINNTYNLMVRCYDEDKCYYIDKNEFMKIINNIINCKKEYLKKYNDYDVYLDEYNYKHYYINGLEDYRMFFNNNGCDALLYNDQKDINNIIKRFTFNNKNDDYKIHLSCYLVIFSVCFLLSSNISLKHEKYLNDIKYIYYSNFTDYNISDINVEELINYIHESEYLSDKQKKALINYDLLEDILKVTNDREKYMLTQKLNNISLNYFTPKELEEKKKKDILGYYNVLKPNILHVKDIETENSKPCVLTHEFCHLLQNGKYVYIKEACAEIINQEYYNYDNTAYLEEVKIVKILMEIIGPRPVFNCCFSGNTNEFENAIKEYLNKKDAEKLLSLFTKTAYDFSDEINNEIYELLDKMYYNKYNNSFTDDYLIMQIKNDNSKTLNRNYFNYRRILKQDTNIETRFEKNILLTDALKKGLIRIDECSIYYPETKSSEKITFDYALSKYNELRKKDKFIMIRYTDLSTYDSDYVTFNYDTEDLLRPYVSICEYIEVKSIINKFPEQFDIDNNKTISHK